jgi:beta-mannanase
MRRVVYGIPALAVLAALAFVSGCGVASSAQHASSPPPAASSGTATTGSTSAEASRPASTPVSAMSTPAPAPVTPAPAASVTVKGTLLKLEPPAHGAYVGTFVPPAPWDISAVDNYASLSGKRPAIVLWYQPWTTNGMYKFDAAACISVLQHGAIPLITWEPWDPGQSHFLKDPANQPAYSLASIVNGKYDTYIRTWARGIRSVRGPVILRPMHEMNGTWYPWGGFVNGNTPALYRAAWRHIHDIFAKEHVRNVTWMWSINRASAPDRADNTFAAYYPGDDYVDWTGVSGFNWGTSRSYSAWQDLAGAYGTALPYLETLNKPICYAEIGCVENGGNKAAWLTDSYARLQRDHPKVKAIIYYDALEKTSKGTQDWRIDSSTASLHAFQRAIADPYFLGGPASTLSDWTRSLGPRDWQYLRGFTSVY